MVYMICDYDDNRLKHFQTMEEAIEALRSIGEVALPSQGGDLSRGYYTQNYYIDPIPTSRLYVCQTELQFDENAKIEPISQEKMQGIVSLRPHEILLGPEVILEKDRAFAIFNSLKVKPITFDKKSRTMIVPFYCLVCEESDFGDEEFYFKCSEFNP